MGISLCMIVKNEEDWIEGAVQSVRSIVDEVIIVDTGSTDSTPSRIAALADKTLNLQWKDSFGDARNVSLAEAGEPWILVLDADERIAPKDLPVILEATRSNAADGYHLIQRNYVFANHVFGWTANQGDYEEGVRYPGYVDNPLIRLFRNSPLACLQSSSSRTCRQSSIIMERSAVKSAFRRSSVFISPWA